VRDVEESERLVDPRKELQMVIFEEVEQWRYTEWTRMSSRVLISRPIMVIALSYTSSHLSSVSTEVVIEAA